MTTLEQKSNSIITISLSLEQRDHSSPSTWTPVMTKNRKVAIPSNNDEITRMKKRNRIQRRMKLFVLVRILLQYLDKVDPAKLDLAKEVMKDCERKHNTKDSKYTTLENAIHDRLRDVVGETHWTAARLIQKQLAVNTQDRRKITP